MAEKDHSANTPHVQDKVVPDVMADVVVMAADAVFTDVAGGIGHDVPGQALTFDSADGADPVGPSVHDLLPDPDRRRSMGQALRARAMNRFAWDDAVRRILAVYDAVRAPRPDLRAAALSKIQEGDHARETR